MEVNALPIGNFDFFWKTYNKPSSGKRIMIGIIAMRKKVPKIKNGGANPNWEFSSEPMIGPNNSPRL